MRLEDGAEVVHGISDCGCTGQPAQASAACWSAVEVVVGAWVGFNGGESLSAPVAISETVAGAGSALPSDAGCAPNRTRSPEHCGTSTCACVHRLVDRKPAARHPARSTRRMRKHHWRSGGALLTLGRVWATGQAGFVPLSCGTGVTSAQSWRCWQTCPRARRRSPPPSLAGAPGCWHFPTCAPWRTGAQEVVRCTVGCGALAHRATGCGSWVAAGLGKEQSSESHPS